MELRNEVIVQCPAELAWALLGEGFADIGTWTTSIEASWLDGPLCVGVVRTCAIPKFGPVDAGTVRERLVAFDRDSRHFAYEAFEGLPSIIERAINRWTVEPVTDQACRIRSHATLELRGWGVVMAPLIRLQLRAGSRRFFEELRFRLECGRPHPRKHARAATVRADVGPSR